MKTAIKLAILAIALAAMSWCCLFIYWHLKISNAVRQLETQNDTPMAGYDAFVFLAQQAGCRALPYLVRASDPKQQPFFLERSTALIQVLVYGLDEVNPPWIIAKKDSSEQRQKKCELLREFWRQNGHRHHQTWRLWTKECVPKP